jgi:hypothetical protein
MSLKGNPFLGSQQFPDFGDETDEQRTQRIMREVVAASAARAKEKNYLPPDVQAALKFMELDHPYTQEQLRTQYRKLATKYHPDAGGNHDKFNKLQDAYEKLSYGTN